MKFFKLTPDEEEKFFECLPRFFFYYLCLFAFFWYGLSVKPAEEIKRDVLSGNISISRVDLLNSLLMYLLVAYLIEKGYISKESSKVASFMLFGLFIMILVVIYIGKVSVLFIVTLLLIYINTLIKVKEEFKRKEKKINKSR